jgi:glycosyltransferase involved in cell wall biosynthesis
MAAGSAGRHRHVRNRIDKDEPMSTVGLCMIVKDEAHVIERCLTAVRPLIDAWTIVDTGSTDGTQDLIRSLLDGIPGELAERPWKDFAHNRSESLTLARSKADYSLVIDADEVIEVPAGYRWPELTADVYSITHMHTTTAYWLPRLVANRLPWRYQGVLHEYIEAPGATDRQQLEGIKVVGHFDGGRSQGLTQVEKYARDAVTLEQALVDEPNNARYRYYLARSYRDSEQWDKAIDSFRQRTTMGGFEEEIYDSLIAIAFIQEATKADPDVVIASFLAAYENRPTRAEPLCSLARYLREQDRFHLAQVFAAKAVLIPRPSDVLFVDESTYAWRSKDELAVSSYWTGDHALSAELCQQLLAEGAVPEDQRGRVADNLRYAEDKLRSA